jgi:hypothetical protein
MGYRHFLWAVKIHNTLLVNTGTFSFNRTQAHYGYTFNVIDIEEKVITVSIVDIKKCKTKKMVEVHLVDVYYIDRYYDPQACFRSL